MQKVSLSLSPLRAFINTDTKCKYFFFFCEFRGGRMRYGKIILTKRQEEINFVSFRLKESCVFFSSSACIALYEVEDDLVFFGLARAYHLAARILMHLPRGIKKPYTDKTRTRITLQKDSLFFRRPTE